MLVIKRFVESIEEEVEGAKEYAEKYVEAKAKGDINKATRYKEMANDELKHAAYQHEWALECIETISKIFTAPVDMLEKWSSAHARYVERVAWIRQMLSM